MTKFTDGRQRVKSAQRYVLCKILKRQSAGHTVYPKQETTEHNKNKITKNIYGTGNKQINKLEL